MYGFFSIAHPILEESYPDINIKQSKRILIGMINNLIDNSIYWLQIKWPHENTESSDFKKLLFLNCIEVDNKIIITVGDNGTGFQDETEQVVKPFFTRKNGGMGIGLHYVKIATEMMNGTLILDDYDNVPSEIDGAVVSLIL